MATQVISEPLQIIIEMRNLQLQASHADSGIETFLYQAVEVPNKEGQTISIDYRLRGKEAYCELANQFQTLSPTSRRGKNVEFLWTPGNYVGKFELLLSCFNDDGMKISQHILNIDVKPSKLQESDYHNILNSLRDMSIRIYEILSAAKVPEFERAPGSNIEEEFKVLEENLSRLENIVYQISLNPRKKLETKTNETPLGSAFDVDPQMFVESVRESKLVIAKHRIDSLAKLFRNGKQFAPGTVKATVGSISYDVPENRLLKRFLYLAFDVVKILGRQSRSVAAKESNPDRKSSFSIISERCDEFGKRIFSLLKYDFLSDVRPITDLSYFSPSFQRDIHYARFYDIYNMFRTHPYFQTSDIFRMNINDLADLYEYWSVVFVAKSLLAKLTNDGWLILQQGILKQNELGFGLSLNKLLFTLKKQDKVLKMWYQPHYTSGGALISYTHPQKPDIAIELDSVSGSKLTLMDPKYRSELSSPDPEGAINKMHVYKDSIRSIAGKHVVEKAFAIYPGDLTKPMTESDTTYPAAGMQDLIGAFALRPAEVKELEEREKAVVSLIDLG